MKIESYENEPENAVVAELARKASAIEAPVRHEDDGMPFLVLPTNVEVKQVEYLLAQPVRIRQKVRLLDARSFIAYVSAFKDAQTRIFATPDHLRVVAVFDYHAGADGPQWGEHRAILTLRHDPAFTKWKAKHNAKMDQVAFAEFLEDSIPDVVKPAGAVLFEIASNLEVKRNASFLSEVRLSNGARQFQYQEEQKENSPKGTLTVPETFVLGLRVFEGDTDKYQIEARFRYRLTDQKLSMWFSLVRIEDVIRDAFAHVLKDVEEGTTIKPFLGSAASQANQNQEDE